MKSGETEVEKGDGEKKRQENREYVYLLAFLFPLLITITSWSQVASIPAPAYVYDGLTPPDIDYTNSFTSLSANWAPITQYVDGYEIAIGTAPGGHRCGELDKCGKCNLNYDTDTRFNYRANLLLLRARLAKCGQGRYRYLRWHNR